MTDKAVTRGGEQKVPAAQPRRLSVLLQALGIDLASFERFLEWALCEHLVLTLSRTPEVDGYFFERPDALKAFRDILRARTRRAWSEHDLNALFERTRLERTKHYRTPVPYEEYVKLLWQVPWECAKCHRRPPEVVLHVDHIVPASKGGSSRRPNLQFLCREDNLAKSDQREVGDPWLDLR
jgi:hypothetical protein